MSVDKSLKPKNLLQRHRNVLTRAERIAVLRETGLWTERSTAIGLPKVAHRKAAVGKKSKAKKETAAEAEKSATEPEAKT